MIKLKCILAFLLFSVLSVLCSCKVKEYVLVPVEVEKVKIEYQHSLDSIYLHDSITTYIMQRGDTVFMDRYKYKIKEVYKTDTIHRVDSIPKVVTITKIQEVNKINIWLKILMGIGGVGILVLLGFIVNKFKVWKLLFLL